MITKEDVNYAYRLLLGREPDNEATVNRYVSELRSVKMLRELFMGSMEFRQSLSKQQLSRLPRPQLPSSPMHVQLQAAPEQLAALLAKVAAQWQHLGQTEPHWSVLTNDSYTQDNLPRNQTAFYASGAHEVTEWRGSLARAGLSTAALTHVLELGCGVGRVTMHLARAVPQVTGVDISAPHLALAQARQQQEGIHNIQWAHLQQVAAVAELPECDAWVSRIVLQHNPPPVMAHLLRGLLHKLKPGGVAWFQLPTYKAGYRFEVDKYLAVDNTTSMEMHCLPQRDLLALLAQAGCEVLEIREDDAVGLATHMLSNTLLVQKR